MTVATKSDMTSAMATLKAELDQETTDQVQRERQRGQALLPLSCLTSSSANHQPGDQALSVQVTVSEHCTLLAYSLVSVQQQAMALLRSSIPQNSTIVSITVLLLEAKLTDAIQGTGTLTVHITAFLQNIHPNRSREGVQHVRATDTLPVCDQAATAPS